MGCLVTGYDKMLMVPKSVPNVGDNSDKALRGSAIFKTRRFRALDAGQRRPAYEVVSFSAISTSHLPRRTRHRVHSATRAYALPPGSKASNRGVVPRAL